LIFFFRFLQHSPIKRIETLATVTTDIRAANYTIRVPIVGKDEVAQLQENFNAMADELEHIRERFYQSNKLRGGAGIGLTLVKDWIEAMGGSVAVESTLGEGSRFTLYLLRS
jgi:signal transduction histidine kinase